MKTTVDGRDPAPPGLKKTKKHVNFNKINYISTGARLFPSRVSDQKPPKKIQALRFHFLFGFRFSKHHRPGIVSKVCLQSV